MRLLLNFLSNDLIYCDGGPPMVKGYLSSAETGINVSETVIISDFEKVVFVFLP
jgi:hypothetical protein